MSGNMSVRKVGTMLFETLIFLTFQHCISPFDSKLSPYLLGSTSDTDEGGTAIDSDTNISAKRKSRRFLERGIAKSSSVESGDDSSTLGSPRRLGRSLLKKPIRILPEDSPGNKATITKEDDIEIYDLSSTLGSDTTVSEIGSPRRSETGSPRKDKALRKHIGSPQVCVCGDQGGTNTRTTRSRTTSQTSIISVTSAKSISLFTRSKCHPTGQTVASPKAKLSQSPKKISVSQPDDNSQTIASPKAELSRSPRKNTTPASSRQSKDNRNGAAVPDKKSNLSPSIANRTRRRTADRQKEELLTPKRQKVVFLFIYVWDTIV